MYPARVLVPAVLLAVTAMPNPAGACSLASPVLVAGSIPEDGATGVPLDASPIVIGEVATLRVTAGGDPVPAVVVPYSQGAAIEFEDPLLPETTYVIEVEGERHSATGTIAFTTGLDELAPDGEVPEPGEPVVTALTTEMPNYWLYQCSSPSEFVCVNSEVPEGYVLVVDVDTENDEVDRYVLAPGTMGNFGLTAWYRETPAGAAGLFSSEWTVGSCVSVRLRDLTGREGPARELCGDEIDVFTPEVLTVIGCEEGVIQYQGTDSEADAGSEPDPTAPTPDGPGENDGEDPPLHGVQTDSAEGCAVHPRRASGFAALALLPLLGLLLRRRG